ncbi:MAG: 3-phosphoglycerate dehydrogenase [Oscillospiraceae bacterium]|nr:3-phosphoglycerate dehydrogenase [Oscillospiraceae bacterium]
MKILTLNKIAACGLAQFPASYTSGDDIATPDAILVRSASMHDMPLDPATVAIARAGAGTNNIPIDACTQAGVCVFNTPGANANAVKELVIAGLFLSSRKVYDALSWCQSLKGKGDEVGTLVEKGKGAFGGPEIAGKTLGLIGLGAIGSLTANAAAALGMRVIGCDPYINEEVRASLDASVQLVDTWDDVLAQSDYISLNVPLTAQTKGAFNAEAFAKAKDGLRLLNFARAALVNDTDLIAALQSGKVAAYVTDFPTDEVIGVPGVTAIPHLGASTPESEDNCAVMAAQQITAYLETGAVKNSVNLPATSVAASFSHRVCVVHSAEVKTAVLEKIGAAEQLTSNVRGEVAYTVADTVAAVDAAALQEIPSVLRVRALVS